VQYYPFLNSVLGEGGWSTPHLGRFTPGKDTVPILQEIGWASGPVWKDVENLASTGYRTPTIQPVSESLYRLSHLGGPNLDENFNTLLTDVWITN